METKTIRNNAYILNMIKTEKFKTIRIQLSFGNELSFDSVSKRSLIPYLLKAVSKKYDTRESMSAYLENMYAARFNVGVSKIAKSHFINFDFSFINDQYTFGKESLYKISLEFLKEILNNPFFNEETFEEEKRLMREYFSGIYTNKLKYAFKEMQNNMFKDEIYRISPLGDSKSLEKVTLDECINEYNNMLKNDLITMNVVGDIEFDEIEKGIKNICVFTPREIDLVLIDKDKVENHKLNEIVEKISVKQAKLVMGYRLDVLYRDKNYYDAIIFNTLFGGSSEGLLFKEIRENMGLVYFISSSYDPYKGVLFVTSGINSSDYNKVIDTIDSIVNKIINQEYSLDLIETAKIIQINGLIESLDSNLGLASRINRDSLFKEEYNPKKLIENLNLVTKDGISEVAKKLKKDTFFLLRDDKDE